MAESTAKPKARVEEKDPRAARAEALKTREKLFEVARAIPKEKRPKIPDAVPRILGGIGQNCGKYFTVATTWYEAAIDAYEAGQVALGDRYRGRGDAAMAQGEDCMAWW